MVSRITKPEDLHLEALPKATAGAFLTCITLPLFAENSWYLAGGTALTLQVGHRQSVDLDFFSPRKHIDMLDLERKLVITKKWKTTYQEAGTLYGIFDGAKMSFIEYPFFKPSSKRVQCGTIGILVPADIAVMKIIAISQRGTKRDFFDLYWYCINMEPLEELLLRGLKQYPGQENNLSHLIKSLAYFDDAERDPEPKILFSTSWKQVKLFFKQEAKKLVESKYL